MMKVTFGLFTRANQGLMALLLQMAKLVNDGNFAPSQMN